MVVNRQSFRRWPQDGPHVLVRRSTPSFALLVQARIARSKLTVTCCAVVPLQVSLARPITSVPAVERTLRALPHCVRLAAEPSVGLRVNDCWAWRMVGQVVSCVGTDPPGRAAQSGQNRQVARTSLRRGSAETVGNIENFFGLERSFK